MDFSLHSYFSILYIIAFLPIVLVAYQVVAQRLRWAVLLVASYAFFWAISSKLIVFILISTVSVYLAGRKMGALFSERDALIAQDKTRKKELKKLYQKKARLVCGLGVGFNLLLLACLKYLVFFGEVAGSLLALFGLNVPVAVPYIGVPIGISFYTLMAASYLFDIYRGTIAPDTNLGRIALFLSFFPQIMEGPICRYGQTAEQLWAGTPINKDNLYRGSVRILWGFAKKMIVADRLNMVVKPIFADYTSYDGGVVAAAAVLYTLQLYCVNTLLTKTGPGKQGAQLRMGIYFALNRGYKGVLTIDGNNKDSIEDVHKFIEKLQAGYDFVQGSRFIRGGHAVNTPPVRYAAVRLVHAPLISLGAHRWFTDTTNAYCAYSREYLTHPDVRPLRDVFMGYELLAYLSIRATQLGMKACEVPVTRAYPATGKTPTKINGFKGNSDLMQVLLKALAGKYNP